MPRIHFPLTLLAALSAPVPSISFGGRALLAGLVLGIVAWARWCR